MYLVTWEGWNKRESFAECSNLQEAERFVKEFVLTQDPIFESVNIHECSKRFKLHMSIIE